MTHATHSFEIELDLSRDWGGEIRCDGVFGLTRGWSLRHGGKWDRTDLFAGVDLTNPEVSKLIANIMDFVGSDAEVALDDVRRESAA